MEASSAAAFWAHIREQTHPFFAGAEALWRVQQSPALAETMAMALAESGRYAEAVRWQREAIDAMQAAGQTDAVARMQPNLARYASRQPCRTPWAATDPVHFPRPAS